MENLQHTPGPWRGEGRLVFAGTHSVAFAQYSGIQSENAESFANARLIAAAPELLEAVLAALPYIEDLERDNITDLSVGLVSDKELTRALSAMVAAIEKAKGLTATAPK